MLPQDPCTGRIVQPDAQVALSKFRKEGGQPFHKLDLATLRETYERNCRINGFQPRSVAKIHEYIVGEATVRVYEPATNRTGSTPVIIFAHGGGWVMGSLETHDSLCRELALQTGLPVVAVEYRLAPEHPFPAAYDDVKAAWHWVIENRDHGLNCTGVILVGDSAGGQIMASLAVQASYAADSGIIGQVLLYPVTDVGGRSPVRGVFTEGLPLVDETMDWFVSSYVPAGTDLANYRLSPARAEIGPYISPVFMVSVDLDPLAADGSTYVQALVRAGGDVTFRHVQGVPHGIFTSGGVYHVAKQLLEEVSSFIRSLHRKKPEAVSQSSK